MTIETAQKIVKGITDKIECNTADIDDWAEFWGFTREEYEEFLDMGAKVLDKRPKGKWTPGKCECPCCGEDKFKDLDADIWADWQPKYCPNCGAEMEE